MPSSARYRLCSREGDIAGILQVGVERIAGALHLRYEGLATGDRVFPVPAATGAAEGAVDGLWRHTCCEAFVGRTGEAAYREFNFSPSGEWAVFAFSGYRQRTAAEFATRPAVTFGRDAGRWHLDALIPAALLPDGELELGLAAVLEAGDGRLDYLALHHPADHPDFHDRRGFILRLP